MLCWLAAGRILQLEEIVSFAGLMFQPDRCRLSEKIRSVDVYQL